MLAVAAITYYHRVITDNNINANIDEYDTKHELFTKNFDFKKG